jgi:hypothetical protein
MHNDRKESLNLKTRIDQLGYLFSCQFYAFLLLRFVASCCHSHLFCCFSSSNPDLAKRFDVLGFDRPYGLVVRVPGYRPEMYYVSCEERTEFMYVM